MHIPAKFSFVLKYIPFMCLKGCKVFIFEEKWKSNNNVLDLRNVY